MKKPPPLGRKFAAGNPGRPKGSRNKLGEAFLSALHDDFEVNGVEAIAKARAMDPLGYMKIVAGLLPAKVEQDVTSAGERIGYVIAAPDEAESSEAWQARHVASEQEG